MLRNFCGGLLVCREENNEPGEKGAGGGAGEPKPEFGGFTEAQMKAIGAVVNSAVTAHKGRGPSFEEQLKAVNWAEMLTPVIKGIVPSTEPKAEPGKKPELSDYEKQLMKLQEDVKNSEKARIEAENRAKSTELARRVDSAKLKLRSALTGNVVPGAEDHVVNHLTVVSNRLVVDENGDTRIKVKRPEFPGFPPVDVEVSIEDGLKDILSESELKIFVQPPKGSGGGNPGPGGKGLTSASFQGEAKTDAEKAQRAMIKAQELTRKYGNG